jgi:hypothetical protein
MRRISLTTPRPVDHDHPPEHILAETQHPILGECGVARGEREWVVKHTDHIGKVDAMLAEIGASFGGIPLKPMSRMYVQLCTDASARGVGPEECSRDQMQHFITPFAQCFLRQRLAPPPRSTGAVPCRARNRATPVTDQ